MASSIDKAIAKLDQILLAATGPAPAAAAAAPAPAKSLPTSNSTGSASTSSLPAAAAPAAVKAAAGKAAEGAREVLTTKAQIKVARIVSAEPLENSAKLLRLQADLGGGETRQVMAGLAQFISPQQLTGSLVCVASNLKPAKLAGQASEAMVLAAEAADAAGNNIVRTLLPPEGSQPGDLVHLDGSTAPAAYPKVLKLDEWRKVVPGLVVAKGGKATFEGTPLVTSQGLVMLPPEIPDGSEIH
ncbi:hypothetical protein OEZ86_005938 [Tetradesmus obliquus]|nr:hypothetical protein OEZ86_005938 [Tetradesmus obliquus]